MTVPAVVAAGEGRASKAIQGESKVYLDLDGMPLVAHVVSVLQHVPEVSEVWVVGNAARLERILRGGPVASQLRKPLIIVPQFRNLYDNAWQTYRRLLQGAGPQGRDPKPEDAEQKVLYLSADLPFATPQEISLFLRSAEPLNCDYALGLADEKALEAFYPRARGQPGIRVAYFNVREGRFRQNNLHLVKPAKIGNRHYIEETYEHRYQKEFGNIIGLAWKLLRSEGGGLRVLFLYLLVHLAGVADRHGWRWWADFLRHGVFLPTIEQALSRLLRADLRFVVTHVGGCAIDIDHEDEYAAARQRFAEWREIQAVRAQALCGPLLPTGTSSRESDTAASGAPTLEGAGRESSESDP